MTDIMHHERSDYVREKIRKEEDFETLQELEVENNKRCHF